MIAVTENDWSGISTGDLITLNELFGRAIETEDGMFRIELSPVQWSRCAAVKYEIAWELQERDERGLDEN